MKNKDSSLPAIFAKTLISKKAEKEREKIKNCKYNCKLANAFYTNFLLNSPFNLIV